MSKAISRFTVEPETEADALGRNLSVKHPDGTTTQTNYDGRATEVTDEGNGTKSIQRISQVDGLGRMVSVCEVSGATQMGSSGMPGACGQDINVTGFLTSYAYDPLNDLLSVSQGGLSSRTFAYDSLSRLTSATNPESGVSAYTYDANGNLATRTQPEPNQTDASETVTTSYTYDTLNRMTAKEYSDDTSNVDYNYDETSPWGFALTNQIGRLTTEYDFNTGSVFSYDPMGRVTQNHQCTPQNCGTADFPIAYTYDVGGDILTSTDGQVNLYTRTYNAAQQLASLTSSYSDANHPGTLFTGEAYNAPGDLTKAELGNNITETFGYNTRLEMTSEAAGSVYSLSLGYAPDGDVTSATDSANGNWTYSYDDFNRLATASGPSQPYTYAYDRFGNRWNQELSGSCTSGSSVCLTFDANNHINNGIETYDAAGNLMSDGFHTYFYDAEHHLVQVDGTEGWCQSNTGTAATACYTYDAEGRRVRRSIPGVGDTDDYLYDLSGHFITQVSSTGWWVRGEIYAGGEHIATYENDLTTPTTFFTHADQLGTERVQTAVNGSSCETITSLPFGDGMNETGSCDPTLLRFTGKQRDWESNLDYFGARYNSSQLGRFMSVDPDNAGADSTNPQSWNMYSYVLNHPLNATDPDGLNCVWDNGSSDAGDDPKTGTQGGCESQGGTWDEEVTGDWNPNPNAALAATVASIQNSPPAAIVTAADEDRIDILASGIDNLTSLQSLSEVGAKGQEGAMAFDVLLELPSAIRDFWNLGKSLLAAGAKAYPDEIAGYKVGAHAFQRMAVDLGHRVPSAVVEEVIKNGQTIPGDGPGLVQKFLPGVNDRGVTVLIDQNKNEIISIRVGGPTRD